jgi:hypothetical protein
VIELFACPIDEAQTTVVCASVMEAWESSWSAQAEIAYDT